MKRASLLSGLTLSALLFAAPTPCLELGSSVEVSNMNFESGRSPANLGFTPGFLPVGFKVYGEQRIDDSLRWNFGLASDRILRNLVYSEFSYSGSFYSVSVGPFLGVLNTAQMPVKAGMLASVRMELPGVLFAFLKSNRSINLLGFLSASNATGQLDQLGDFLQENNEIGLGFYQQNAILSFFINSKTYAEKKSGSVESDLSTDYGFSAELFQKNAPFKAMLSFLFRNVARNFELPASSVKHSIGSLMLGVRGDLALTESVSVFAGLESSIYSFGLDKLIGEFPSNTYLFSSFVGVKAGLDGLFKSE
jgi:hypothetical protein